MAPHHCCRCSPELWFSRADSVLVFLLRPWPLPFDTSAASFPPGWVLSQLPRRPDPSFGVTALRQIQAPERRSCIPPCIPLPAPRTHVAQTSHISPQIASLMFFSFSEHTSGKGLGAKPVGDSLGSSLSLNPAALQVPFSLPSHVSALHSTSRLIFSRPDCLPSLVLPACIPYALVVVFFFFLIWLYRLLVAACRIF